MNKLVVILTGILCLTGCTPHTTYIQGGERSQAIVEASMIGGKITLIGPFVYCKDSIGKGAAGKAISYCPTVVDQP